MDQLQLISGTTLQNQNFEEYVDLLEETRDYLACKISNRLKTTEAHDAVVDGHILSYLDGLNFLSLKVVLEQRYAFMVAYTLKKIILYELGTQKQYAAASSVLKLTQKAKEILNQSIK